MTALKRYGPFLAALLLGPALISVIEALMGSVFHLDVSHGFFHDVLERIQGGALAVGAMYAHLQSIRRPRTSRTPPPVESAVLDKTGRYTGRTELRAD